MRIDEAIEKLNAIRETEGNRRLMLVSNHNTIEEISTLFVCNPNTETNLDCVILG